MTETFEEYIFKAEFDEDYGLRFMPTGESVIRCKDCKWYRNRFNQHYCCQSAIDCPLPDDYCSRAERKEEAENDSK